jgi:hypothetical protein
MSRDTIFAGGGAARAYVEVAQWYAQHAEELNAKEMLVPFFGFGRLGSALCRPGTNITGSDYVCLSRYIAEGIFAAEKAETAVDKPRFHKGKAVAGGLARFIDIHSAGFIDWVVENGTLYDKACVGMSIPGQTMHGWLTKWTGNFDSFYTKFEKVREECKTSLSLPGTWNIHEADFFDLVGRRVLKEHYDVVAIDPPRLCGGADLYSTGWRKFNQTMGGTVRIKPWTTKNYWQLLDKILSIDCDVLLVTWTEGNPPTDEIKEFALRYGTLEDETHWELYQKSIYGWRIGRQKKGVQ